jgi:hypothetical protein
MDLGIVRGAALRDHATGRGRTGAPSVRMIPGVMFTPAEYKLSILFRGDAKAALELARAALVAQGFEILAQSASELSVRGPGLHDTRQSPLLGATELSLQIAASSIEAQAVLGGVARMKAFVYWFPPGLGLVLALSFLIAGLPNWWVAFLAIAPWLVISPLMGAMIERRTVRAIEGLVRSMAVVAKPGSGN